MGKIIDIKITDVKTQREMVMYHLQHDGEITSFEAFQDYGITRHSSIKHNLRTQGYNINTNPITRTNRFGNSVTFAKYTYSKPITFNEQLNMF